MVKTQGSDRIIGVVLFFTSVLVYDDMKCWLTVCFESEGDKIYRTKTVGFMKQALLLLMDSTLQPTTVLRPVKQNIVPSYHDEPDHSS